MQEYYNGNQTIRELVIEQEKEHKQLNRGFSYVIKSF